VKARTVVLRVNLEGPETNCFKVIIDKPSLNKCAMSNQFPEEKELGRIRDASEKRGVA
jgi:hypothetical protein